MAGSSQDRQTYAVACSCGAGFSLDARGFGKPRSCGKCGATVTIAWGRDPKSRKTVPVAMVQKKAGPKPGAGPSAPSVPSGAGIAAPAVEFTVKALCACGNSARVPESKKNNPPRCGQCGKMMRIEDVPLDRPKGKIEKFERAKPSAPLLPLHLRAPLRVRIKKGAQFFDCVCGERVMLRADSGGKPIQCLGCDRLHILEFESAAPPPPGPAAASGAKPRGAPSAPPAPSRPLLMGEFLCRCGEIQPPRTSRTGRNFECKKCGRKGSVEIEKAADGKVTMNPKFTYEPPAVSAAAPAKSVTAPAAAPSWTCPCGKAVDVHKAMSKSEPACPSCGRRIRLEKVPIVGSTRSMIRPVFVDKASSKAAPSAKPPPAAPSKPRKDESVVAFEELAPLSFDASPPVVFSEDAIFETAAQSAEDGAPPDVESDAQVAICECSAEILVSRRDIGQTIQCPACADVMTVEETPDPRTKAPVLGIRSLGSTNEQDWKLDDFQ